LRSQILIGIKIKYIDTETGNEWMSKAVEISSMISGLIKTRKNFLKRDLNKGKN